MRRTPHVGSGTGHGQITEAELLKMKKSGQFPDETVRIKGAPIHYVNTQKYYNNRYKGDSFRGTIIIVGVILSNFVSISLI